MVQIGGTHITRSFADGMVSRSAAVWASGMAAAGDVVSGDAGSAARASAATAMAASMERRKGAMTSSFDPFSLGVAKTCLDRRVACWSPGPALGFMALSVILSRRNFRQ